mgnify:CR=1 FL=1
MEKFEKKVIRFYSSLISSSIPWPKMVLASQMVCTAERLVKPICIYIMSTTNKVALRIMVRNIESMVFILDGNVEQIRHLIYD